MAEVGSGPSGGVPEIDDDDDVVRTTHVVYIDSEMKDGPKHHPPLRTDLKELADPPERGRSEYNDKLRYDDYVFELEKKYFKRLRLPADRQTIVRTHRDVEVVVKEIRDAMDSAGHENYYIGLDTEKEISTLQTSVLIKDYDGKGHDFERNVLWQIKTAPYTRCRNIFQEGFPAPLRDFLSDPRLVFVGKAIKGDLKYIADTFKISNDVRDKMAYIELDQMYNFFYNLLWHPDRAAQFLKANHDRARDVKQYWSVLGEVGLKTIVQFLHTGYTMSKRKRHRDQHNNFDEHRHALAPDESEYALNDSHLSLMCALLFGEIMGVALRYFVRVGADVACPDTTIERTF